MNLPSPKPAPKTTNDTTELAKERNRQSVERTVTSWIGSSLLLMGFGISIEEIHSAMNQSFPQNSSEVNLSFTHLVSLSAIAFGIALLIPIVIAHQLEIQSLTQDDYLARPARFFNLMIVVGAVILFALIALAALILVISQT